MQLYFLTRDSEHEVNLDLFVMADDIHEAVRLWCEHYAYEPEDEGEVVKVHEVPQPAVKGAVDWATIPNHRVLIEE